MSSSLPQKRNFLEVKALDSPGKKVNQLKRNRRRWVTKQHLNSRKRSISPPGNLSCQFDKYKRENGFPPDFSVFFVGRRRKCFFLSELVRIRFHCWIESIGFPIFRSCFCATREMQPTILFCQCDRWLVGSSCPRFKTVHGQEKK